MTATQNSPQPSAGTGPELMCRPLIAMAARGFDRVCLLQMQDAAFRYVAQSLQSNKSVRGQHALLWSIVDLRLGGDGRAQTEVSPGHIAAYMRAKAFFSQLPQRDALFDVAALSSAQVDEQSAGLRLGWLAQTLIDLQRDADRLTATTPMFATEIAAQVRCTVGKRAELPGLTTAMRDVATRAATITEDEHDVDQHRGPSFS